MEPFLNRLPAIETERLHLRPLLTSDAEAFRGMTDDPAITSVVHFLSAPFTLNAAEALLQGAGDGKECFWGAWPHETRNLAGTVGTHLHGEGEIEIGYWFSPAVHGLGYATEAVRAIIAALTQNFPERIILAECRPENLASWRLLLRVGFHPAGVAGERPGRMKLIFTP